MSNSNSSPAVTNCVFSGNDAGGVDFNGVGGGMSNDESNPTVLLATDARPVV